MTTLRGGLPPGDLSIRAIRQIRGSEGRIVDFDAEFPSCTREPRADGWASPPRI
jgi:hypothetical protein